MKTEEWLKWEYNNSVYSKVLKHNRENLCEINCSFCRYHKGENQSYKTHRSWKKHRRTQYK